MAILDTNFLISVDRNNPRALKKGREMEQKNRPLRVPRIAVSELWVAVGKGTRTQRNIRQYNKVLTGLPQVDLTEKIAKQGGKIHGESEAGGKPGVGIADGIIAATALDYDEPVITNDTDYRNRIQQNLGYSNLDVETY